MVGQQVLHAAAIVHSYRLAGDGVVFPHCAGFHGHFVGAAHEIQAGQRAGPVIIDLLDAVAVAVVGEGPGGERGAAGAVAAHQGDDRQAVFGVEVLLEGLAVLHPAGHVAVRVVGIGVAVGERRDRLWLRPTVSVTRGLPAGLRGGLDIVRAGIGQQPDVRVAARFEVVEVERTKRTGIDYLRA